ncbi:MAG: CocE/NonD family hydrolase, partial [Halothece sp. Uz-M2-17]|nr:CocE/NonD family hydrolase [Halothece sp. Uz-M2-17]
HMGTPGPAIGFLQEALRWWDKWLKGIETKIMDEPMLRVWMQESVPPTTKYKIRPGRWVAEPEWPSAYIKEQIYPLGSCQIAAPGEKVAKNELTIQSPLSVGLFAGKWCSYSAPPDLPHDQREEDGGSLVFDSDFLEEPLEILGAPVVDLELSSNQPVAMIAVRLSDIAPDDNATRVTYGLLNLTHRNSNETPELLEQGKPYRIRVQLNDIAQSFPKGHRLRISISTSYWPLAWIPPKSTRLTIYTGNSSLILPTRNPRESDQHLPPFEEAEGAPAVNKTMIEPADLRWTVIRDLAKDESTLEVIKDEGKYYLEHIDLKVGWQTKEWYTFCDNDFNSARGETYCKRTFERENWSVKTVTSTVLRSDESYYYIDATLDAYEGDQRVYSQSWDRKVPREGTELLKDSNFGNGEVAS